MMKRISRTGLVLVVALCSPLAIAQTQYKSTMPDGRVVYGDKPAPGAAKVEQLKTEPTKGVSVSSPKDAAALKSLESARGARAASDERLRAAEEALRKAEAAQAAGKDPTEGDRIGTKSGAQRLTDAYWARQKQLEADVKTARANYERAKAEAEGGGPPATTKPPR